MKQSGEENPKRNNLCPVGLQGASFIYCRVTPTDDRMHRPHSHDNLPHTMQENMADDQHETRTIFTAEGNNVRVVKRLPDLSWFDTCRGFVHSFVHSFWLFCLTHSHFPHNNGQPKKSCIVSQTNAKHWRNFPETGAERIIMGFPGDVFYTIPN